jgi:hypothetical protein
VLFLVIFHLKQTLDFNWEKNWAGAKRSASQGRFFSRLQTLKMGRILVFIKSSAGTKYYQNFRHFSSSLLYVLCMILSPEVARFSEFSSPRHFGRIL